ncbi:hypothetical protein C8Q80DRAFT_1267053 [Daedaleopsis nitida]|nr:hypothetical protein C8Q80DRAFT_1267053 [Daedaleopsis nitida]
MAARPPRSQEGAYASSSPSSEDPFHPHMHMPDPHAMPAPERYYDNDSEHLDRYDRHRDTYGSDGSNGDDDRDYDQGAGYYYRESSTPTFANVELIYGFSTVHAIYVVYTDLYRIFTNSLTNRIFTVILFAIRMVTPRIGILTFDTCILTISVLTLHKHTIHSPQ